MKFHSGFDGGLGVKLGGVADLEQDVFHDVAGVGALKSKFLFAKGDIVEAPGFCGEGGGVTHFSGFRDEGETDDAAGSVAGGPAFARAGVGSVTIGAEALAVNPCEG